MCNSKRWLAGLLTVMMCLAFAVTDKQSVRAEEKVATVNYVVCMQDTTLYEIPDWKTSTVLARLPKDSVTVMIGTEGAYTKVNYNGIEGYIDAQHGGYNEEAIAAYKEQLALAAYEAELALVAQNEEVRIMAAIIQCEAGNQPIEGQIAVGAVIMNRVKSEKYPNTITEVIFQPSQFGPAGGKLFTKLLENDTIKESCREAAKQAFMGVDNVGGAMYFKRAGKREGIVIGNHVFY